jgi:hypothetical protein
VTGKQPRCRDCQQPIAWFRSAAAGSWRAFDPKPVDARTYQGPPAVPVENDALWWRLQALVEDLQVRRECGEDQAREEVYDMPWYVPHTCAGDGRGDDRDDTRSSDTGDGSWTG